MASNYNIYGEDFERQGALDCHLKNHRINAKFRTCNLPGKYMAILGTDILIKIGAK